MSEMVERVAAAINTRLFGPGTNRMAGVTEAARDAIEAMREPTDAMVRAGMVAPRSKATSATTNTYDRHASLSADIYRAMIDTVLSEEPK
jgi:hypothetical protein